MRAKKKRKYCNLHLNFISLYNTKHFFIMPNIEKTPILTDSDKRKLAAFSMTLRRLSEEARFVLSNLDEVSSALRHVMFSFSELEELSNGTPIEDLSLSLAKFVTDPASASIVDLLHRRTDMVKSIRRLRDHAVKIDVFGDSCPDNIFDGPMSRANSLFGTTSVIDKDHEN